MIAGFGLIGPEPAPAQDLPGFFELGALAISDPGTALPQIDAALGALSEQEHADVRLQFDLARLKVDVLTDQGTMEQAAGLMAELAGFAAANRDALQQDPAVLWADAAARFEALGLIEEAFDLHEALLASRNALWAEIIIIAIVENRRPLVAVGAAHMLGEDGLVATLEDRGLAVTRIQ